MTALKFKTPVHRSNPFENVMNDFFEGEFRSKPSVSRVAKAHANVFETDNAYKVELATPGFSKSDFAIEVNDDMLTIKAKKDQEEKSKESAEKMLRREFKVSAFERSFKLTDDIDKEAINASYENGILKLELTKKVVELQDKHKVIAVK